MLVFQVFVTPTMSNYCFTPRLLLVFKHQCFSNEQPIYGPTTKQKPLSCHREGRVLCSSSRDTI